MAHDDAKLGFGPPDLMEGFQLVRGYCRDVFHVADPTALRLQVQAHLAMVAVSTLMYRKMKALTPHAASTTRASLPAEALAFILYLGTPEDARHKAFVHAVRDGFVDISPLPVTADEVRDSGEQEVVRARLLEVEAIHTEMRSKGASTDMCESAAMQLRMAAYILFRLPFEYLPNAPAARCFQYAEDITAHSPDVFGPEPPREPSAPPPVRFWTDFESGGRIRTAVMTRSTLDSLEDIETPSIVAGGAGRRRKPAAAKKKSKSSTADKTGGATVKSASKPFSASASREVATSGVSTTGEECTICSEAMCATLCPANLRERRVHVPAEPLPPTEDGADALTRQVVVTPCLHCFHRACLRKWLRRSAAPTCPCDNLVIHDKVFLQAL